MNVKNNNGQLNTYLSATILVNLFCLFINGYGADLGFWEHWTKQLSDNGYYRFDGNYPPLYIHWLYIISKGLHYFAIPIEPNDLCKFLWEFPVLLCHCLLTWIVYKNLKKFNANESQIFGIMLLTVFNPAILVDGPIWGQVDLVPTMIALCAILINFSSRYAILMLPIYSLALLTKFQMVCFLPIIGILFLHKYKTHLLGIILSLLVILLVFSPFIAVHYHTQAFQQAYIDTLGQYPVITMNAANLWVLLVGNNAPDNIEFLSNISPFLPEKLAYPKYFGMFLYAAICLCIAGLGINSLIELKKSRDIEKFNKTILFYSMVSAVAFFTLLPAMHERYLFPAVACALVYSSVAKKHLAYAIAISAAAMLNMLIILGINGSNIWDGVSTLVTIIFAVSLLQLFAGSIVYTVIVGLFKAFFRIPSSAVIVFFVAVDSVFIYLIDRHTLHDLKLIENQILLTSQRVISAKQDHGTLQINRSFDKKYLAVGNRRFMNGIGTHANSTIIYALPLNSISFDVIPGLDDEVESADVLFEIWEDAELLWTSKPYFGHEGPVKVHLDLHKGKELKLIVKSHGESSWDHADWINPIITVDARK